MSNNKNNDKKLNAVQYLMLFQDIANKLDNDIEGIMHCVFNSDGISEEVRTMLFGCLQDLMKKVRYLNKVVSDDYIENYEGKKEDRKE